MLPFPAQGTPAGRTGPDSVAEIGGGGVHFCTPTAGLHPVSLGQSCRGLPEEKGEAEPPPPATVPIALSQHFLKPQLERAE